MNRPTDNEQLLADALADAAPASFRESLLGETLRLARRRRQFRQMRRVGVVMLAMAFVLALWLRPRSGHRVSKAESVPPSYQLVSTVPLPASAVVVTQPFTNPEIASAPTSVRVITTAEFGDGLRELSDDELLALAPAPAALVRLGPHSEELVFVNEDKRVQ